MTEAQEIELKFSFEDGEALRAWLDRTFAVEDEAGGWRTHEITDRYFDTADLALGEAGFGARLRTVGSDTTLTVKADIEVTEGLHRRLELEAPATRTLDTQKWPDSEARSRLIDVVGGLRLIERFAVGQQRRERAIEIDGTRVVASIDEGEVEYIEISAGNVRQFEVELLSGDPGVLRPLAERIVATNLARPEDHSKLQVASDLVERTARVAPDDSASDASRKLLRRHLVRMLERESATRAGDVLALKQMRVATRRMRATWRVFRGAFGGRHAFRFEESLRHVADLLGTVRDLDVLLETVDERDDLGSLASSWRTKRAASFEELVHHLDSGAYEKFVEDFLKGTGSRAHWSAGKRARVRVSDLAPGSLERARNRMMAAAENASDSNEAAAWHALRIAAKRMRYSLEAFREVSEPRAATDFIEALRTLQDNLGEMNDASVAAREAATWLTSGSGDDAPPEQRVAVAGYIGDAEAAVARARSVFADTWRPVADAPLPRIAGAPDVAQVGE